MERDLQDAMHLLLEQGEGPDPEPQPFEVPVQVSEHEQTTRVVLFDQTQSFDPFKGN